MGIQIYGLTHEGSKLLPSCDRQFISFSFGGKNIEDFNLIAIFPSDRLEKGVYSPFSNLTSRSDVLDGQLYWGYSYEPLVLSFELATDGITSKELDSFKSYFAPGVERELVLAEYPNRAINARVQDVPVMSLLPFEDETPFKYTEAGNHYERKTYSTLYKGNIHLNFVCDDPFWYAKESFFSKSINELSDDEFKTFYEDQIPIVSSFSSDKKFLLANKQIINEGQSETYFYNPGTAVSYPKITFIITPSDNESNSKINLSKNLETRTFKFNYPEVYCSYKKALSLTNQIREGTSVFDFRDLIIKEIYHPYVRAWLMAILNDVMTSKKFELYDFTNGIFGLKAKDFMISLLKLFFKEIIPSFSFSLDTKNGESSVKYSCHEAINSPISNQDIDSPALKVGNFLDKELTENAGDMPVGEYLTIEGNSLMKDGKVILDSCEKMTHSTTLSKVAFDFKITY